jgi:hypothetical protein
VSGAAMAGITAALAVSFALAPGLPAGAAELSLIDDFSGETSALGTRWEGISDQVMGGQSVIDYGGERREGESFLRLRGEVSLKNNGGFVQVRLKLNADGKPFDAGGYAGLALRVRGRGPGYYIYLRTTRTVFPWSFYGQELPVEDGWNTVYLPFAGFRSENMASSRVDPRKLVSVAIVAAKREFSPELDVESISWYR